MAHGETVQSLAARCRIDENGCWLWRGARTTRGYGRVRIGGRSIKPQATHRLMYELAFGEVPEGQFVLHKCDVVNCINPAHLWAGSLKENTQDMIRKGRARMEGLQHWRGSK